jgi:HSP20 family protein
MSTSLIRRGYNTVNPWRVFDEMERQMWDWMSTPSTLTPLNRLFGDSSTYVPPINLYETDDDVLVAASLPGIDAKKIDVQVRESTVTITGEQAPLFAPGEGVSYRQHLSGIRQYGKFEFHFRLPVEVVADQAQAVYQDGVLRLRFPKSPNAKPTRIAVNVESGPQAIEARVQDQIQAQPEEAARKK